MSTHELKDLLDQVPDTRELVLRRQPRFSVAFDAWEEAHADALGAYATWRATSSHDAYLVYRAAQDRADAAQDELARSQTQTSRTSVS